MDKNKLKVVIEDSVKLFDAATNEEIQVDAFIYNVQCSAGDDGIRTKISFCPKDPSKLEELKQSLSCFAKIAVETVEEIPWSYVNITFI